MVYKIIGLMSGSSLDGLDILYAELHEAAGKWSYQIIEASCPEYSPQWQKKLKESIHLSAIHYQLLHTEYGEYLGEKINEFMQQHNLHHKVNLISSHGHTTFHIPEKKMTHQLGDGAAIASATQLPVVTDLRSIDVAFGGQGAPIVPMGEKLLFNDFRFFLNLGGIANLGIHQEENVIAFDVCPANRVLNMLAEQKGLLYDDGGRLSEKGNTNQTLSEKLNALEYYAQAYPKSLANDFGTNVIFPIIESHDIPFEDKLHTFTEHICRQIKNSLAPFKEIETQKLFITGGGAFNIFLIKSLEQALSDINFEIYIPEPEVIKYKEALIMALLGILRWREQYTVLASVTGAIRNSIGGALWLGTEA